MGAEYDLEQERPSDDLSELMLPALGCPPKMYNGEKLIEVGDNEFGGSAEAIVHMQGTAAVLSELEFANPDRPTLEEVGSVVEKLGEMLAIAGYLKLKADK